VPTHLSLSVGANHNDVNVDILISECEENIMAKTITTEPDVSQKDETRRQRKKQARQEAKTMLKIERAKKDVKKAQKKVTRAQANVDESQTHLHNLEEKLQQIRSPQEPQAEEVPTSQTSPGELPELQPEDFKIQEVSSEAYQEPLLLDNTPSEDLTQSESNVSADPPDELTTPSPETIVETDTTSPEDTRDTTSSPDEDQSIIEHGNEEPELSNNHNASPPEEALATSTPGYNALHEENTQEENQ
jgi:hypothetical protein